MTLPTYSRTVIVGGGIAGISTAYHLAKLGRTDTVLLERHQITSGTTWHAAGLIMQLRSTHAMTGLARYNVELYANLEQETGLATGFKQNGTLGICRTRDRLFETRRIASIAKSFDIEAHMIGPAECEDIYPALDTTFIEGAIYIPKDGQTNAVDTASSLIAGARQRGVQVFENTTVMHLEHLGNGEYRVETESGVIQCETLVLACGLWTREIADQLGIRVPLYACEHFYVLTEPLAEATAGLPVLRDTDGHVYVKEDAGKWLVGAFEPTGKPLPMKSLPSGPFIELAEDWDHFSLPYSKAMEVLPILEHAGIAKFFNGPESFTPDLLFALGEAPGLPNCFVSAGYNSEGIEFGAGAGRALAEWIVEGEPTLDLSDVDIARFHPFQTNKRYLHERTAEILGLHYKPHWPHYQPETARGVRKSVLHDNWVQRNASFGEGMGWERPMWFATPGEPTENMYSHTRPNWFERTAAECHAARHDAIVLDQSSFGKHLVQGRDACRFLQNLCAGDIDVPVGKLVYTHMLNNRGGIETDITVNRLDENEFLIISSATVQPRDRHWIERQLSIEQQVTLIDVTSNYAVLSVQGPRSREILGALTDIDVSPVGFPFATSRRIDIGYASVIANRLTYVGEIGFELHVPTEMARAVFDDLMRAGQSRRLSPAGYHALEHLRCERAYREYQLDLTPEDTPLEAGLGFTVALDKPGGFIGRDVLMRQQDSGPLSKRLVMFKLEDPEPVLFHEELLVRDGSIVGYISSGAYGFSLGTSVGMGYVHHGDGVSKDYIDSGVWEIEIAGERYPASASLRSFFDPKGERARR